MMKERERRLRLKYITELLNAFFPVDFQWMPTEDQLHRLVDPSRDS